MRAGFRPRKTAKKRRLPKHNDKSSHRRFIAPCCFCAAALYTLHKVNIGSPVAEDVELDYEYLMQNAMRYLMRDVLQIVADIGDAPGQHHFYIEFLTGAEGVEIPDYLFNDYPEKMTIVLQHQFEDLTITDEGFGVTLWFSGRESRLEIPYDAVLAFSDPSVQFGLRFDARPKSAPTEPAADAKAADAAAEENADDEAQDASASEGADIVSLDAFRKK